MITLTKAKRDTASKRSARRLPRPDGTVRIAPSLLAADFGSVAEGARALESAGADWLSVDVMDGHFVPNLSFGPDLVKSLRDRTDAVLDAHLMVDNPKMFAPIFADAGADLVIIHAEACSDPRGIFEDIRRRGAAVGIALKPATQASAIADYLKDLDLVLVMTVEPGFGGQSFRRDMLPKIQELRKTIGNAGNRPWLMVDGGINAETAVMAAAAGADAMVAGTSVFRAPDPAKAFREIKAKAQNAFSKRHN